MFVLYFLDLSLSGVFSGQDLVCRMWSCFSFFRMQGHVPFDELTDPMKKLNLLSNCTLHFSPKIMLFENDMYHAGGI